MENSPFQTSAVRALEWHQLSLKYAHLRVHDPGKQARLMSSLAAAEQQAPVIVVAGEAGQYVLIDGYARVAALKTLGRDLALAVELAMSESDALVFSHRHQTGRGPNALEEAWLLLELTEVQRLEQRKLAVMLSKSPSWISRRLALLKALPDSVQEEVRRGVVSAQAAMKYLAPLARANWEHCRQLVLNLRGTRTSVREMERLYRAYKTGTLAVKERLVANPLLFLKLEAESRKEDTDVLPETSAETVIHELEAVSGFSRKAKRSLRQAKRKGEDLGLNEAVCRAYQEMELSLEALRESWEETGNAGSRHPNGGVQTQSPGARPKENRRRPEHLVPDGPGHSEERTAGSATAGTP